VIARFRTFAMRDKVTTDPRVGERPPRLQAFSVFVRATLLSALAIAGCVAGASIDSAVIVNSGSTNAVGYKISVSSDGKASATLQNRDGSSAGSEKAFTVPKATAARFFADLAAARGSNAATVPCMKSASFGSTTHITWQGWVSPDLDCPPKGSAGEALVKDVDEIRQAAGISSSQLRQP